MIKELRRSFPKADLTGIDTGFFAHCLTNAKVLPESRLNKQIFADIRNVSSEIVRDVDAVIYLAAISNDIMGCIDESLTMEINCHAALRLARQAKKAGAKAFVFASSCSVYGFAEEGAKTEASSVNPLTAYARSKILAEQKLKPLAGGNFKITCFRFATACGMSERLRLDLVLNDFAAGAAVAGTAHRGVRLFISKIWPGPWPGESAARVRKGACFWSLMPVRMSGIIKSKILPARLRVKFRELK